MDSDLRRELDELRALVKDNHRMLRHMRFEAWFHFLSHIVFWVVVILASLYTYQKYVAPYFASLPSSSEFNQLVNQYRAK